MTTQTVSDNLEKLQEPDYVDLIAGRMDAESRLLAKKLHELGYIYALYGALDGLSLSYSMVKYCFDVFLTDGSASSSDVMHEWLLTPGGIATAASSAITLIVFSMLANHFDDDDKNLFKRYVAILWPYCRDAMKGLKNAYKGVRSAFQVVNMLGVQDLRYMIVPVGLLLGGLSVLNRIWFRRMITQRKDMMKANSKLLAEIRATDNLTEVQIEEMRSRIKSQSMALRKQALLSAAYGGVVDGLYLYIGVLGLCSLAPPALIAMTVFCAIYFLACIATRMYEEYDFQRKLVITQAKIELALHGKEIENLFNELQMLSLQIAEQPENEQFLQQQRIVQQKMEDILKKFESQREKLRSLSTLAYSSALLAGMRNGLAAYGAIASAMFAVATILFLCSASFPPALLITCVALGMVCLIGFIAHSLLHAHKHQLKQEEKMFQPSQKLAGLLTKIKETKKDVSKLKPEEVKTALLDGMVVDPSPQFFFQEWFEVVRSLFSGMGKGSKAVDYTMNPLQEADEKGHYHDTPIMLGVTVFSVIVHALALALRAHARGFGRPPIDNVSVAKATSEPGTTSSTMTTSDEQKTSSVRESGSHVEQAPDSRKTSSRSNSLFSFFYAKITPKPGSSIISHSKSTPNLTQLDETPRNSPQIIPEVIGSSRVGTVGGLM